MPRHPRSRLATRLSAFYAAAFLVSGARLPFWPVWLASRVFAAASSGLGGGLVMAAAGALYAAYGGRA